MGANRSAANSLATTRPWCLVTEQPISYSALELGSMGKSHPMLPVVTGRLLAGDLT